MPVYPSEKAQKTSSVENEWVKVKLGDVCEIYQPETISKEEMCSNGAFPVFGANGKIGYYDRYNHEEPEVLVCCRGATCGTVNMSEPCSWITGNAMVVHPKDERLNQSFLYYLLMGGVSLHKCITGSAQPQITKANLTPVKIPLPPLPEQRRISTLLGSIEKAIDLERRCEESLTTIKRAAMHVVFTKGLHNEAQRETPLGLVPESWETRELGLVCEYDRHNTDDITLPYLGMEQIESGTGRITGKLLPIKTESSSFLFNESHVLFGRLRPYLQKVWLPDQEGRCSTEIFPIKPKPCLERRFLFYWLLRDEIIRKINATCTGTRMPRANMNEVLRFPFPIPPLHEQQEIVDFLTTLDQKLDIHRRKRACLENIFRLFLHNLTRGTLRFTELPEGCF